MFWKSMGIGRGLGILLAALALVPQLAPYSDVLHALGVAIGGAGVANAVLE